jgi:hypothetical protein
VREFGTREERILLVEDEEPIRDLVSMVSPSAASCVRWETRYQ